MISLRTIAASFLVLGLLAACGNDKNPLLTAGAGFVKGIGKPKAAPPDAAAIRSSLTPEVLAQIGKPIILVEIEARQATASLIEVAANGEVRSFLDASGIGLSLKNGILIATRGLGHDLMAADVAGPMQMVLGSRNNRTATRVYRYLDGEDQMFARRFQCSYQFNARRVVETCQSPDLKIENQYWRTTTGGIKKSRQWVSPQVGYVVIEPLN